MTIRISLANHTFEIIAVNSIAADYCREYLTLDPPQFSVEVTPEDIAFEGAKAAREDALEGLPVRQRSDSLLELTALQRKITQCLFSRDVLLFHGSLVAVDGVGYLFTAKSGTGKSTHTALWRQVFGSRAVMINDDKPFLAVTGQGVIAYGSPWQGKHRLGCNAAVPLGAICVLERGVENRIVPLEPRQALAMLMQQSQRPQDPALLPKYLELIDGLAAGVKLYRLTCNMDPQAALVAYQAMANETKGDPL